MTSSVDPMSQFFGSKLNWILGYSTSLSHFRLRLISEFSC